MTKLRISMILAAVAFAAAGSNARAETVFGPADAKEVYYWVSQNSTWELFTQYDYVALKKIAEQLGVQVRAAGPTTIDLPSYIAAVDQVCAQKPAGVTLIGGWDASLAAAVDNCISMGVPFVVNDGDLAESKRLAYVGTNWSSIGEQHAAKVMELLPDGGKIAVLHYINAGNMREAAAAFKSTIEAKGGGKYQIVTVEDDGADIATAAQVSAAILSAHPDLAAFVGMDGGSGPGIVQALREAGKEPGAIKVTAMEQTPSFFKSVKEGFVQAIVVQNRQLFTYYAIKLLYDFNHNGLTTVGLKGFEGQPIPRSVDTGVVLVTPENVDSVLTAMGVN